MHNYIITCYQGHYILLRDGIILCHCDSYSEAMEEQKNDENICNNREKL